MASSVAELYPRTCPNQKHSVAVWGIIKEPKQVILARLRIVHTLLTHEYLKRTNQSTCAQCTVQTSVKHIVIDCPRYDNQRKLFQIPATLKEALSDYGSAGDVLQFLKNIQLYSLL